MWLAHHLSTQFDGTLLVVSHDRAFLDAVVTDVVHFHRSTLTTYRGDIASFDEVRRAHKVAQARAHEAQEMRRKHLQVRVVLLHYRHWWLGALVGGQGSAVAHRVPQSRSARLRASAPPRIT